MERRKKTRELVYVSEIKHKYFCTDKIHKKRRIKNISNNKWTRSRAERGQKARMCIHSFEDNDRCSFMAQIACTFELSIIPRFCSSNRASNVCTFIYAEPGRGLKSTFLECQDKKCFYGFVFARYCFKARHAIDKIIPRLPILELFNVYHQAQQSTSFLNIVINPDEIFPLLYDFVTQLGLEENMRQSSRMFNMHGMTNATN